MYELEFRYSVHVLFRCAAHAHLQRTPMVSFDDNPMAEPNFAFYDVRLKELVGAGDEQALEFFRCLALCHTVMPDDKAGQ